MKMYAELTRKMCSTCSETKEATLFNKNRRSKDGLSNECKACRSIRRKKSSAKTSAYNKAWRKKNLKYAKLRDKKHNLRRKFDMTLNEFNALKAKQNGVCAICFANRSSINKDLCVDHCHTTGKIRGLLCDNCNRGIGLLKDSEILLQSAIKYLQNSKK